MTPPQTTQPLPFPVRRTGGQPLAPRVVRVTPDLTRMLRRYQSMAEKTAEVIDAILWTIDEPARPVRPLSCEAHAPHGPRPARPAQWLASLDAVARPDGTVEAVIHDRRKVLPPHLGALLLALAEDTGASVDACVGFKTLDQLAARMAALTGGPVLSGRTLNKFVYRLRGVFADEFRLRFDPVQTHRRLGRRIAVLRSGLAGTLAARGSS